MSRFVHFVTLQMMVACGADATKAAAIPKSIRINA